jgi:hypothetical protein
LPKERVAALAPRDVEAYLLGHGWEADQAASSSQAGAFRYEPAPGVAVLVPRDRAFLDYALRVGDVVQTLAAVEGRTAWEVLEELSSRRSELSPNGPGVRTAEAAARTGTRPEGKASG